MMELFDFVKPELLIVAVVLYFLSVAIKRSKIVNTQYIPLINGGIGILICMLYVFASCSMEGGSNIAMAVFTALTQGIVVSGLATYVPRMAEWMKKGKEKAETVAQKSETVDGKRTDGKGTEEKEEGKKGETVLQKSETVDGKRTDEEEAEEKEEGKKGETVLQKSETVNGKRTDEEEAEEKEEKEKAEKAEAVAQEGEDNGGKGAEGKEMEQR